MPRVIIFTSGTLGDHLPFVALGRALQARGYSVCLAINRAMQDYALRSGLEVFALSDMDLGPEQARQNAWAWDHWHNPLLEKNPKRQPFDADMYVTQARELIDLCRDADLLLSTSIRSLGFLVGNAVDIPWLTVSMNPSTFWQPPLQQEQQAHRDSKLKEYYAILELLVYASDQLGVDVAIPPWSPGWLFSKHVLLASSSHFSQPDLSQLQPHSSVDMTGFWFYEDPDWADWRPDPALQSFCTRRPIVLTFSSQPLEDPRQFLTLHVEAAARLNMPLLVQRGWADFSEADLPSGTDRENVMFVDFLPHDWILAQASCTIQHGGIGSIARALRQSCPLLIEPFGNDQVFNASQIAHLEVGAALHPFKMTVDDLVQTLQEQVLAPGCRHRAGILGAKIEQENGFETACRLIDVYLERIRSGEEVAEKAPASLFQKRNAPDIDRPISVGPGTADIPRIIHQTWKDTNLPPDLHAFSRTWQDKHPDWTYYLWTDEDNRAFLQRHYPWFLSIYDHYSEAIMRVDAVRYFILYHYGGVYADLDTEALQPLGPLVEGRVILLGLEPEKHLRMHQKGGYPLPLIVSNAIMGSAAGHPFWEHVFRQLVAFHRSAGALDATGPFLLTRAYESYPDRKSIRLEPPECLSPADSETPWYGLSAEERACRFPLAYAVHHWLGTWWREPAARRENQVKVSLVKQGTLVSTASCQFDVILELWRRNESQPRVSCLMVTANRLDLAQRAVACFRNQTYPNRELVIVDDSEDDGLAQWLEGLDDDRILLIRLPSEGRSLGELRNIAVSRASGSYVAQWDDDDLSDPVRLEFQMAVLDLMNVDACTLERQMVWWPDERRLAVSVSRVWESSLVCAKGKLPLYPELRRGEDTPVIDQIVQASRVALLDLPHLYIYVFHGANTFDAGHWHAHWDAATVRLEEAAYSVAIRDLQNMLGIDLTPWMPPSPDAPDPAECDGCQEVAVRMAGSGRPDASVQQTVSSGEEMGANGPSPKILVLTPVKDAARFLSHFWDNLASVSYPHSRIALAFLESDSIDGTYDLILENLPCLRSRFVRVDCFKQDYSYRMDQPRWAPSQQFQRRSIMARSRNHLLTRALQDADWVLWIDVDVQSWPADVIQQLLAAEKDIVVPNCLSAETGETFDFNSFKLKPGAEALDWAQYLVDDILQPPKGYGRFYLSDLRQHSCVELDAVGGTMLLIRADLHREGLVFPSFSYKHFIETEGLALMARDMGYSCWGLPHLEIFHP